MRGEVLWELCDGGTNLSQFISLYSCFFELAQIRKIYHLMVARHMPLTNIKLLIPALIVCVGDGLVFLIPNLLDVILGEMPFLQEPFFVKSVDVGAVFDDLIHHGLGECRLILLIVAVPSVSNDVHKNVFSENLPVLYCQLHDFIHHFGLICIYVKDWCLDSFSDVSTIQPSPCLCWGCCEADLVVGNNMDDPVSLVMLKIRHLKTLINDALASKGSITMNDYAHCLFLF